MASQDYERRIRAKEEIWKIFEEVRKKIKFEKLKDDYEKFLLRQFLGRLNSLSRDFEMRAMHLADEGKDWSFLKDEAKKAIERLKGEYIKTVKEMPMGEIMYKELIDFIKSL